MKFLNIIPAEYSYKLLLHATTLLTIQMMTDHAKYHIAVILQKINRYLRYTRGNSNAGVTLEIFSNDIKYLK